MNRTYIHMMIMAITTYLIRVLPLIIFKKEIKNNFIKSFLYYLPYVCLSAMTFPAIINATNSMLAGGLAFVVAIIATYKDKSLLSVALISCVIVFVIERFL